MDARQLYDGLLARISSLYKGIETEKNIDDAVLQINTVREDEKGLVGKIAQWYSEGYNGVAVASDVYDKFAEEKSDFLEPHTYKGYQYGMLGFINPRKNEWERTKRAFYIIRVEDFPERKLRLDESNEHQLSYVPIPYSLKHFMKRLTEEGAEILNYAPRGQIGGKLNRFFDKIGTEVFLRLYQLAYDSKNHTQEEFNADKSALIRLFSDKFLQGRFKSLLIRLQRQT